MSAQGLADKLGVDKNVVEGIVDAVNNDQETKDDACEAIGALNPDGFFKGLCTNDFRAMSRASGWGKAGAVASTGLKCAGVVLAVMGGRAAYRHIRS